MLKRRPRLSKLLALAVCLAVIAALFVRDSIAEAETPTTKKITIIYNGEKLSQTTTADNVGDALTEAGIKLDSNDRISVKTSFPVKNGMIVYVNRIEIETVTETKEIPYETLRTFSREQKHGTIFTVQKGEAGEKQTTYKVTRNGSRVISKIVESTSVTKEPVPCIISIGSKGEYTSRGGTYRTKKVLTMKATAYDAQTFKGRKTSTGRKAVYSMAAVDPKVIPLGSRLYIEGYGYAIAGDTGKAIKGNRIDLCFETRKAAINFGRRTVKVHILSKA